MGGQLGSSAKENGKSCQRDILKCAWYANGKGVLQILSKLETVSCRRSRLAVIADAIAGWTKSFLISPILMKPNQIHQDDFS